MRKIVDFVDEPAMELPFEVPDEFIDREEDEEEEMMYSKTGLLRQLAAMGRVM